MGAFAPKSPFLFVAGFLLILQVMIGFVKNSFRRRALRNVKPFAGCRQVFPQMGSLGRVGVVCKVESLADVQAFEELVQFILGSAFQAGDKSGAEVIIAGMVMEGKKCFKDKGDRDTFVEFCKVSGFDFLPKEGTDWKGVPDSKYINWLVKGEFDLLISLNPSEDFTLEYLSMICPSRFVTGVHPSEKVPYCLVLEPGEGSLSFKEYVEKLLSYLRNMQ